jgi:hypothetical protein
MSTPLKGNIVSIEGETATLRLDDGGEFRVPVRACEGIPTVGRVAHIIIAIQGSEDAGRQALAREVLNELLKNP